jgi:hypothetical protein
VGSDICDWEKHDMGTDVLTVKELMSSSVTVNFSRKALLSEVRNKEGNSSDRSFVSELRLKIMGERRQLYVPLWGRGGGGCGNYQCVLIILHFLFIGINSTK